VTREDLDHLGYLGAGGFGYVSLEQHKAKGDYYALKALSKGHLIENGMAQSAVAEKEILLMMENDCIVKLYNTFKDDQTLYFLLEACVVGDLYLALNQHDLYGKPECAAYYSAVVINSFEYIHSKRVVYRDLKPENILLNDKGEAKLCDMGIAKVVVGRTYTMCGTPEYMAPEVIKQKGHSHAVDWWCLGILVFELLSGETPFCNQSTLQIYKAINKGIDKIKKWPRAITGDDKETVRELCKEDPNKRLPKLENGVEKLRARKLWSKIKWDALGKDHPVPFKPKVDPKTVCKGRVHPDEIASITVKYKSTGKEPWDNAF
jgi:serine/threonine protein kinase